MEVKNSSSGATEEDKATAKEDEGSASMCKEDRSSASMCKEIRCSASTEKKNSASKPQNMMPIASFVRIKPIIKSEEKGGGVAVEKHISGWNEDKGTVVISGVKGGGSTEFDHMCATLPPDATQARVYDTIAAPLVRRFLDGFDVDLISYGQTGSGKTYTMFGPPGSMSEAATELDTSGEQGGILKDEHGFMLRAGFESLAAVEALRQDNLRVGLHGSMVEVSILGMRPCDQTATDLLNARSPCYVDASYHLQGARQMPLNSHADVVNLAAAVETRLTRGTKMNDTSSRSHCICALTLIVFDGDFVRESRLQFFDLMGSERFKGPNAAHDTTKSSKATMGGCEGIFANLSLQALMTGVELSATYRRSTKNKKGMMARCKGGDVVATAGCGTSAAALSGGKVDICGGDDTNGDGTNGDGTNGDVGDGGNGGDICRSMVTRLPADQYAMMGATISNGATPTPAKAADRGRSCCRRRNRSRRLANWLTSGWVTSPLGSVQATPAAVAR